MFDFFLEKPTLSYNTTTGGSFYEGQPLAVACHVQDIPHDVMSFFSLILHVGNGTTGCRRLSGVWAQTSSRISSSIQRADMTAGECNLTARAKTMAVTFNITQALKDLNITCQTAETGVFADSYLVIDNIRGKLIASVSLPCESLIRNQKRSLNHSCRSRR